jgi:hypothetical protein
MIEWIRGIVAGVMLTAWTRSQLLSCQKELPPPLLAPGQTATTDPQRLASQGVILLSKKSASSGARWI